MILLDRATYMVSLCELGKVPFLLEDIILARVHGLLSDGLVVSPSTFVQ